MIKVENEKQEIESSLINFKEQFSKVERNQGNVNEAIENSIHRIKEGTKKPHSFISQNVFVNK